MNVFVLIGDAVAFKFDRASFEEVKRLKIVEILKRFDLKIPTLAFRHLLQLVLAPIQRFGCVCLKSQGKLVIICRSMRLMTADFYFATGVLVQLLKVVQMFHHGEADQFCFRQIDGYVRTSGNLLQQFIKTQDAEKV